MFFTLFILKFFFILLHLPSGAVVSLASQTMGRCIFTNITTVECTNTANGISQLPRNTTHLTLHQMNFTRAGNLDTLLRHLTKLKYLNISDSKLDEFPIHFLKKSASLTTFILSDNSIKMLPIKLATLKRAVLIDVSQNPIECTCTTVYVVEKLSSTVKLVGSCNSPVKTPLNSLKSSNILNCNPCESKGTCLHGTCMQLDALNAKCLCFPGFTGQHCRQTLKQTIILNQQCGNDKCQNGGTCIVQSSDNVPICICPLGKTGEFCKLNETSTFPTTSPRSNDSNTIVGVTIGVAIFFAIVVFVTWYCSRIRPKRRRMRSERKMKRKNSTGSKTDICAHVSVYLHKRNIKKRYR